MFGGFDTNIGWDQQEARVGYRYLSERQHADYLMGGPVGSDKSGSFQWEH